MGAIVDPAQFPSLSAYLGNLPDGIHSYPRCQAKGSMVTSVLEGHDLSGELDALPGELGELVRDPPPPTRWLPLVWSEALFHVVCDCYYPREKEVIEWCYRRTFAMAKKRMYRRLASMAGPRVLFRTAAAVHKLFERGTSVSVSFVERTGRIQLRHPPHVHSPLNKVSNVGMFLALLEMAGGGSPTCDMTHCDDTSAVFEMTWS